MLLPYNPTHFQNAPQKNSRKRKGASTKLLEGKQCPRSRNKVRNPEGISTFYGPVLKDGPAKKSGTPKGVPEHSPGLRRIGATPGRRICLKYSPERAAQTTDAAGFCATLSELTPKGLPTRGRREARQPRAVLRSPIRALPNGNLQIWDFLTGLPERWLR